MNPLLLKLLDILWHNFKRFAGVILIAVVLIGGPYFCYRYGYNKGYQTGYAQSTKDRPTYGSVGTVNNIDNTDSGYKWLGIKVNIWKLKAGLGF